MAQRAADGSKGMQCTKYVWPYSAMNSWLWTIPSTSVGYVVARSGVMPGLVLQAHVLYGAL